MAHHCTNFFCEAGKIAVRDLAGTHDKLTRILPTTPAADLALNVNTFSLKYGASRCGARLTSTDTVLKFVYKQTHA